MPKLGALLDVRYQAVGAEACRMTPMRVVVTAALTALAGVAVGWPPRPIGADNCSTPKTSG